MNASIKSTKQTEMDLRHLSRRSSCNPKHLAFCKKILEITRTANDTHHVNLRINAIAVE
jgi:hypothetical protein